MDRRKILKMALSAPALALTGTRVSADEGFPRRPLRMVIPFNAGGPNDRLGRYLAQGIGESLGQTVVVENRGGGDGAIASVDVARAAPDGYSLLFASSSTHVITPALMEIAGKATYDPMKDFIQISVFGIQPACVAVKADYPAKTLRDVVRIAKERPGKLSYAASASSVRLSFEMFKKAAGVDIVAVPYKGTAPAMVDVFAGRIEIYPTNSGSITQMHKEGKMRILAVFDPQRIPAMPDVPTTAEEGMPELVVGTFNSFCTTAGTPDPVVRKLHAAIQKAVTDPAFVKLQVDSGIIPVLDSTPEKATAYIGEMIGRLKPMIKTIFANA